jgi:hypothetical protein
MAVPAARRRPRQLVVVVGSGEVERGALAAAVGVPR